MINEAGYFRPIDSKGKNSIKTGKDILVYAYKDSDPDILEDSVVATPPSYPDQYIIGPKNTVLAIAKAFLLLDSLQPGNSFRQINVVINGRYNFITGKYEGFNKPSFTQSQLDRFGIQDTLIGTRYNAKRATNLPGIITDVRNPRFSCSDYSSRSDWSPLFLSIYYASEIIHEWTHVEQIRNSLPVNSLWAERAAMTKQANLLLQFLKSDALNKSDTDKIITNLKWLSELIQRYRNGNLIHNHLTEKNSIKDGSPIKDQDLHTDDFQFGY